MIRLGALAAILCAFVLAGCASVTMQLAREVATTYRQPGVEQLAPSSVAVIRAEPCDEGLRCLIIQEVDGHWRGIGWISEYDLTPGHHTIEFLYAAPGKRSDTGVVVAFTAQPGHTYTIRANADYAQMTWKPEIVDAQSGQVVSTQVGTEAAY